jgi:hypothetical protein
MLSEIIRYDPDTGHLYWKQKRRGRRMDAPAGCVTKFGDRVITFGAFTMKAQEVVWALKMSSQCFAPIRHLNGDRDDNRFENLYEDRDEDEFI